MQPCISPSGTSFALCSPLSLPGFSDSWQQMNHGPLFKSLMAELEADVRQLQASGHYGDGE